MTSMRDRGLWVFRDLLPGVLPDGDEVTPDSRGELSLVDREGGVGQIVHPVTAGVAAYCVRLST